MSKRKGQAEARIHKRAGTRPEPQQQYVVRPQPYSKNWAVFDGHVLIEGGFFSKGRAEDAAAVYNKEFQEAANTFRGTLNR